MTDPGDSVPQEQSWEDDSDDESSDSELSELVSEAQILSAITYLQDVSRFVNDSRCSCNRVQGMCLSRNQQQTSRRRACITSDCTLASLRTVLSSRSHIESCLRLVTGYVVASVRRLPFDKTNGLPDAVLQVIDALTQINHCIVKILNSQIYQSVLDKEIYHELKEFGVFALTYFSYLTHHVKNICTDTYMRTMADISIIGRHLAQKGLYYTLPTPVWPLFEINNLLPYYITHHEALCERYMNIGKVKEAWVMLWEVFATDIDLVSETLVNVFSCILLSHELILVDVDYQSQLHQVIEEMHHVPRMDDILVLVTLLFWETYSPQSGKLVIDTHMSKAGHLLKIWMLWFHSVGSQLLDAAGNPRADISLRFLRKFAELAIANFQNFLAVKSLCEAYSLAHKMGKWDVVKDVTQIIVSLMPQLGLHMDHNDPDNTDFFMDSVGLGAESGLLGLVAIATYHLNIGQLQMFLHVRNAFFSKVSLPHQTDAKIVIAFSQAVMKRLQAEFLLLPGSSQLQERDGCTKQLPQALCLAVSALEMIELMCTKQREFYLPKDKALNNILGPWQIVHEYLCVSKLTGELFSHTGDVGTGETCFRKGLQAAETFRLETWAAIFHSKLAENALVHHDLKDATKKLKTAQNFIESTVSTSKPCLQHRHGRPSVEFVCKDKLPQSFTMTNSEEDQTSCSCQKSSNVRQDLISDLTETVESRSDDRKDQTSCYLILTDIRGCCNCCQSEIIASCINIMCFQAEILWRKERSICSVSSLLRCSLLMVDTYAKMPLCTNIMELFTTAGLKVCDLNQTKNSERILAETAFRCAEMYFQNLYINPADSHFYPDIENITSYLEIAEKIGRRVGGYHMCSVVASALLLKNSTSYLGVLKAQLESDKVIGLDTRTGSFSAGFDIITLTLQLLYFKDVVSENKQADSKQSSDESEETVYRRNQQSNITLPGQNGTETVSDRETPAGAASLGEESASISGSNSTTNCLRWKILIENFPSLVASKNVLLREIYLQRALRKICEFPHYWLYRQISQSLALCLWEKQMVDAWKTNIVYSRQLEIAAHLTDSMHLTFQHKIYLEYCQLLCKHSWKTLTPDKALINKEAMEEVMQVFKFGGDVTENFKNRLALLPAGWTVVQMTIANFDPSNPGRGQIFVSRINSEHEPITIGLPSQRNQFLAHAEKAYSLASSMQSDNSPGEMQSMLKILKYLQEVFLASHKWLFRGQLHCVRQHSVQTYLDDAGRRAEKTIHQKHGYVIDYTELRSLLDMLLEASHADILSLVECMWPPHIAATVTQICMDVQREVAAICEDQWREKRGPVVLILDNELVHFPWEGMPVLKLDTITRMPSLAGLIAHMMWHTKLNRSVTNDGVGRPRVVDKILLGNVRDIRGFFGNSWPDHSFPQCTSCNGFAVFIANNSCTIFPDRKLDAGGAVLNFLNKGCVSLMGNVWMTPPDDFNKTFCQWFSSWMSQRQHVSIRELMDAVKQACEGSGFNPAGLVVYGLPSILN